MKFRNCLVAHCRGNPFVKHVPLKSIVSSALIPDKAQQDILSYPKQGQDYYEQLVKSRLMNDSNISIWDTVKLLRLKRFANWMAKTAVRVGDQVIKLREDRALLARCLIMAKERPDIIPKLEELIGMFEVSLVPRANFALDGTLLLTTDKSSLMTGIRELASLPNKPPTVVNENNKPAVCIVDGMCEVKALKKEHDTKTMKDLKESFLKNIRKKVAYGQYQELRVLLDQYKDNSLKDKTRAKRAEVSGGGDADDGGGYEIHDAMSLAKVSLATLFSSNKTKAQITRYFAEGILDEYSTNTVTLSEQTSELIVTRKLIHRYPCMFLTVSKTLLTNILWLNHWILMY